MRRAGKPLFRAPASIFWVGLALRLTGILIGHTYRIRDTDGHFGFGFEAGRIAQSVATGHGYGNPFNGHSGPTAWLPPLFPLLLALGFKLFGVYSQGSALFIMGMDSLFSALIGPAVYEIAARCFDAGGIARRASTKAAPVALWSGWMWALYPGAMQYAVHWVWEMSLSACLFTWAIVLALRLRGTGEEPRPAQSLKLWVLLGLAWGAIALSNASLLLAFPAMLLWVLWGRAVEERAGGQPGLRPLTRSLGGAVLAFVVFLVALAPWVVRNERVLHAFVPTRSNFGIEFWHSTQFAENGPIPWGGAMPMSSHEPEFQRYVQEGELRYAHEKGELAKQNLRARPDLFVRYTLERIQFFWFCTPHPINSHPFGEFLRVLQYAALSLAGLLGVALMLRRGVPGASLFFLVFALVPLVYYGVTVQPRFRHPLEPLLTICAVYLFRSTERRERALGRRYGAERS